MYLTYPGQGARIQILGTDLPAIHLEFPQGRRRVARGRTSLPAL